MFYVSLLAVVAVISIWFVIITSSPQSRERKVRTYTNLSTLGLILLAVVFGTHFFL